MTTLNIGDRVRGFQGDGVVISIFQGIKTYYGVRHDVEKEHLHDCMGKCEIGRGWNYVLEELEKIHTSSATLMFID